MKTILIVEDDAAIRESLEELLQGENYEVVLAEHGEAGLKALSLEKSINLVLLDLSMPIMDGKTFLKEVEKRYPPLQKPPILIMTAAGPGDIPIDYDRNMILRKPLDVDDILAKIESVI